MCLNSGAKSNFALPVAVIVLPSRLTSTPRTASLYCFTIAAMPGAFRSIRISMPDRHSY